jgi:hypothetical protein
MIEVRARLDDEFGEAVRAFAENLEIPVSRLVERALREQIASAKVPAFDPQDLAPYVSVVLLDAHEEFRLEEAMRERISGGMEALIEELGSKGSRLDRYERITDRRVQGWRVLGWWYSMENSPPWLAEADEPGSSLGQTLRDYKHHLGLFLFRDGLGVVACTQSVLRKKMTWFLTTGLPAPSGDPLFAVVPSKDASLAFVAGDAHQTWMHGVHRPVPAKADSKNLTGPDLRLAIDPFDDQSFRLDAVLCDLETARIVSDYRGRLPEGSPLRDLDPSDAIGSAGPKSRRRFVGLSLKDGIVWTRSTRTMSQFLTELNSLKYQLDASRGSVSPGQRGFEQPGFDVLIQTAKGVKRAELTEAIDFELRLPFPGEIAEGEESRATILAYEDWMTRGAFAIEEVDAERIFVAAFLDGEQFATVRVQPVLEPNGRVNFSVDVETPKRSAIPEEGELLDRVLKNFERRACIWYREGYAIQDGRLFRPQYKDVDFRSWQWLPFAHGDLVYDVSAEKPVEKFTRPSEPDVARTRQVKLWEYGWEGRTLFDFVANNVESLFGSAGKIWHLLCDDRAGEVADFIYVEPGNRRLCLIHVKGAGGDTQSARSIAPAQYEVVVSQATKNLRFLEPEVLAEYLRSRRGTDIEKVTWTGGASGRVRDRDPAIRAIQELGGFPRREVVVLQPHTTRQSWETADQKLRDDALGPGGKVQFLRLKTLLADLEAACKKLGASVAVWGDQADSSEQEAPPHFPGAELRSPG